MTAERSDPGEEAAEKAACDTAVCETAACETAGSPDATDLAAASPGTPAPDILSDDDDFQPKLEESELHTGLPPKLEGWRRRSATGAILSGIALGLQQVFEPERERPAIIMETSGEPPSDLPVEADLEGLRPQETVVSIRPWLLGGEEQDSASPGPNDEP
jgi:hypothetical protein